MKRNSLFLFLISFVLLHAFDFACAGDDALVEMFSPKGTVKGVRQVSVRFSEQMVPFGDPRLVEPFDIACPEKGKARWADGKNWIYDFDKDIPAGVVCKFSLKSDLKTLSGKNVAGQKEFSFSTGGPAIKMSYPREGSESVEEDQIFVLALDASADEESVISNVSCSIEGIKERVGVRILKGAETEKILKLRQFSRIKDMPELVLQCKQNFPNSAVVKLIWGKGVKALSGVQTTEEQILPFRVRKPFTAAFSCERENANAGCIPIRPMRLQFTSSVPWNTARGIVLRGHDKTYKPEKISLSEGDEEGEGEGGSPSGGDENFVAGITFKGPFPENSLFTVELPKNIKDDAGRNLSNKDNFPLSVRTDSFPPLAKFSARFGIIELKGDAVLPVTLRNLEPSVRTRMLRIEEKEKGVVDKAKEGLLEKAARLGESVAPILPESMKGKNKEVVEGLKGRLRKVRMDKEEQIIGWLRLVAAAERKTSILEGESDTIEFSVPKPGGSKAFEVVGIPLKGPGFYVVEMESRILGQSLLGEQKPMYVPASALVTNLSAHFKWGRESSLVWVTTLDKSDPVKDADVLIRDCNGKLIWKGKTDETGIARVNTQLPQEQDLLHCDSNINYSEAARTLEGINGGLFAFAKTADDMTFVHSSWFNGIEPWRYNLPGESYHGPVIAHSIFDRTLLRAGETVHMKHVLRKHTMSGFAMIAGPKLPNMVMISHQGSEQTYEFPVKWDNKGIAETEWKIPADAKLGFYEVTLFKKTSGKPRTRAAVGGYVEGDEDTFGREAVTSGRFRVEEFRVPLMKGLIQPPKEPLVNAREAEVDLFVSHLSGGGAGNIPVKLRSRIQPRYISFADYEDFAIANGEIKEETIRRAGYEEGEEGQTRKAEPKLRTGELMLDRSGGSRTRIENLPSVNVPNDIAVEMEFRDPNGEVQTVSSKIPLWPARLLVGLKPDSWASSKEAFRFHVVVLDLSGKPLADRAVKVEMFRRKYYSHRKRLVGGFYSYEHVTETKRVVPNLCAG
ncbi:MAG TPA: MG2 domain-containing protein, partial [Thermodesulfovibrionales bacterium]|nr:MG2 domain-containing protein [Thermodesulfovibrionales bacterium]